MKKTLSLALAVLLCAACTPTPETGESAGEAQAAVATYANMDAVKAAADTGTCIPGSIVVGGAPQRPALVNGAWTMTASGGVEISRGACLQIKAGTVLTSADYGGEYENCIEAPAGIFQLAEVDGAARLIDP